MKSILSTVYSHELVSDYAFSFLEETKKSKPKVLFIQRNPKKGSPKLVSSYSKLIKYIADLSFHNRHVSLFFRGQKDEHTDKLQETSLFPSIYRNVTNGIELKRKFQILNNKSIQLASLLKKYRIIQPQLIRYYNELKWSIIQHYGICETPFLDLTSSLQVACSFALNDTQENSFGVLYVLGLPYQTDNITYSTNDQLLNVRLNTICTPQASRPLFQEGYIAGPFPISELDNIRRKKFFNFALRLVAKFSIPNTEDFWDGPYKKIPQDLLLPKNDLFLKIKQELS